VLVSIKWLLSGEGQKAIYNKNILKPKLLQEATSLGAAIAGGVGSGLFKDFHAAKNMVQIVDTFKPDPEKNKEYEKLFSLFKEVYTMLTPAFKKMAAIKVN